MTGAGPAHLRWVDELPPADLSRAPRHNHHLIAAAPRDQPGRWAMLPDLPTNAITAIKDGVGVAYRPAGTFDAVNRQGVLYARYVGPS